MSGFMSAKDLNGKVDAIGACLSGYISEREIIARYELLQRVYGCVRKAELTKAEKEELKGLLGEKENNVAVSIFSNILSGDPIFMSLPKLDSAINVNDVMFHFVHTGNYGDPEFDDVPFEVLLSDEYASKRRELIGGKASMDFVAGDAGVQVPEMILNDVLRDNRVALGLETLATSGLSDDHDHDTTHLDAVDREGNMVAATASGGWIHSSPVIPGLGFALGSRGQMFFLRSIT